MASETSRLMERPPPTSPASSRKAQLVERQSRRSTWRFVHALLWKNWVLKRRRFVSTWLEIAFPTAFILLMGYLKTLTDDVNVPTGWSDDLPPDSSYANENANNS